MAIFAFFDLQDEPIFRFEPSDRCLGLIREETGHNIDPYGKTILYPNILELIIKVLGIESKVDNQLAEDFKQFLKLKSLSEGKVVYLDGE